MKGEKKPPNTNKSGKSTIIKKRYDHTDRHYCFRGHYRYGGHTGIVTASTLGDRIAVTIKEQQSDKTEKNSGIRDYQNYIRVEKV